MDTFSIESIILEIERNESTTAWETDEVLADYVSEIVVNDEIQYQY